MRRIFLLMLALVMTTMMLAENITAEQALQQARSFIQRREAAGTRPRKAPGAAPQQFMPVRQVNGLYLFNVVGGDGFVIVSNDDRATPILGYSDNGTLDPDHMPCNMRAWLQGYADEIAWLKIRSSESNQSFQGSSSRRSHSTADISPLMTTTWDQGEPYNNRCPLYESEKRAVTGCVATAMAQAMYYTETMVGNTTTTTTTAIPAYTTKTYEISMPAISEGTTIYWNKMISNYSGSYTAEQASAIADLMLYCGCSVEMNYGPSAGSNTANAANALRTYFGYSETTQFVSRSYYTYANWIELFYNELSQGRPIICGGQSSGGGHEFVCDGYKYVNNTDYFHFNWGWGGTSDDYYVLSALNPHEQGIGGSTSTDGYNFGLDAIVGIQKIGGNGTVLDVANNVNLKINSISLSKTNIALGETVTITVNVTNKSNDVYDGDLCLVVDGSLNKGKIFLIEAGATQDCTFEYTPTEKKSYTFCCATPTDTGTYTWQTSLNATLGVEDKTPYDLVASDITPTSAIVDWTSDCQAWNLRVRPVTITNADFSNGIPAGWSGNAWSSGYWIISPEVILGGSISFKAGGEGASGSFQVYVNTSGGYYSPVSNEITATSTRQEYTVDLSEYTGTRRLAFIIPDASNNSAMIGDVTIVEPSNWSPFSSVPKPVSLTGLSPETNYEVQVQAVIDDATTNWSKSLFFSTTNIVPVNLTVTPTGQSASVNWTAYADSYEVRYGLRPDDAIINQSPSWLQYDNDTYRTNFGSGSEYTWTWGVMYPGSVVTGNLLTKVAIYETSNNTGDITINIYSDGDNAPQTLLYTEVITTEKKGFHEVTLSSPVTITPGKNLWITLTETGTYPMVCCENTEPNNQWVYYGNGWMSVTNIGGNGLGWMIRGYIESTEIGDDDVEWTTVSCNDKTYTITGLTAKTDYVVQVRGICGSVTSPWITQTFTTLDGITLADAAKDNSSVIANNNEQTIDVTLANRTLYKDGAWNTICLPFNLTIEGSVLDGATAKTLTDATMTGTTFSLTFGEEVTELQAGTPYIIKWEGDGTNNIVNPVFTNVTIDNSAEAVARQTISLADGNVKFIGYYDAKSITAADDGIYYLKEDNKLMHTGVNRTLNACRAYFLFTEEAASREFVLNFGDGMTTSMDASFNGRVGMKNDNVVYDLSGRQIVSGRLSELPKGLYIINGKKVVVK